MTTASPPSPPETQPDKAASTGRSIALVTIGIGVLHMLRKLLGIITQPLIARQLGTTWQSDVNVIATDIVSSLWLLCEKLVNPTVLPLFARSLKEDGEESAWRFVSTIFWLVVLALVVVAPLAWWKMPWIVDLYSQKANLEQRELTVAMSRLMLAGLFFLSTSSLTYVLLNGYKRFGAAALGDSGWSFGILLGAVWAVKTKADPLATLYLLAYGFVIGAVLKLVPQAWVLREKWHLLKFRIDLSDPRVKKAALLAIPLLIGVVTSEGRDIFSKWLQDSPLITDVEGSRAALRYSRTIIQSLIAIFPYALSIGIFPYLADLAVERDKQGFTNTLVGALRACVFVFGPLTAILIAVRFPFLRLVWESGKFTVQDTLIITAPFIAFSLGLIGMACENVLNQSFYAQTRAWAPTVIGLGTSVLFIIVAWFGVNWKFGLVSIAAAESIQKSVKCLVMWVLMRPQLGEIPRAKTWGFTFKIAIGSFLAAFVTALLARLFMARLVGPDFFVPAEQIAKFKLKMALTVLVSGLGGTATFFIFAALSKIEEMKMIGEFRGKLTRKLAR